MKIHKNKAEKLFKTGDYPIEETDLIKFDKCPLCQSTDLYHISSVSMRELKFFSTDRCKDCLFTFRTVSPSLEWFKKRWAEIDDGKLEVFSKKVEKMRSDRYGRYYKLVKPFKQKGLALDIGSAYGTGAKLFRDKGFEVEAVEPEQSKQNYIRSQSIPVVSDIVERLEGEKVYDLILFVQCLEHVDNPVTALESARRLLKDDGVMYVEIPQIWNYIDWTDSLFLTHKSNFTEGNFVNLISKLGLKILDSYLSDYQGNTDYGLVVTPAESIDLLYRKGLPAESNLEFEVDKIEHFFQTVNLLNKSLENGKFISNDNAKELS